MAPSRHLTTRRGFIAALGFGGTGLYGLWAGYGAAPVPWASLASDAGHDDRMAATEDGHGGHDAPSGGISADEFRSTVAEFVERYRLPDGSVHPRRAAALVSALAEDGEGGHGGHDGHTLSKAGAPEPIDVFLLAERWYYEPAHLRLDAGVAYRFRMMATDVSHGASIQFGRGGRMIRLRPNTLAEMVAVFEQPGNFIVYCTVYCGQAHDFMQARIEVV